MALKNLLRCSWATTARLSRQSIVGTSARMMPIKSSIISRSVPPFSAVMGLRHASRLRTALDERHEVKDDLMFCYQCEQTKGGVGCDKIGVCGKTPNTAKLQDLLLYQLKGLGAWTHYAHEKGLPTPEADSFVKAAVFSTLTNVNFDDNRFYDYIQRCDELLTSVKAQVIRRGLPGPQASPLPWFSPLGNPVSFQLKNVFGHDGYNLNDLLKLADNASLLHRHEIMDSPTLLGLQELLTYGLKGMAAYAHHAEMLGAVDVGVDDFCEEVLAFLASDSAGDANAVLGYCLSLGAWNFKVMQMLDGAHTGRYGHPVPTQVPITPRKGKAILISGHDLHDLEDLLKQTEGKGIDVYTHGEMLPAHGYPGLKKYPHLYGNYGGAWYKQKKEFAEFPGPILMTTNCIMDPTPLYADRIFTTGEVGVSASPHLVEKDFSAVIQKAQELPGFTHEPEEKQMVTVGFGHNTVLGVAGQVLDAVKAGELKHIVLMGGCDAPEPSRKYYTEVAKKLPDTTMLLTLGCAKYRFNTQDFGSLPSGLPRYLDMGQCNDSYSALVVATELAKALNTDVNSLPLSLDISWFEQKAVAVLLTLLHLGVKNIRLGPNLPAFLTPDAVQLLVEKFNIMPADLKHPEADIEKMHACM